MDSLSLLDSVVLLVDAPGDNLRKGSLGTIVELLAEETFLVEFADPNGVSYAMPILGKAQLMKVYQEPIAA